jgi:membrane associated rhomboid family serine protease
VSFRFDLISILAPVLSLIPISDENPTRRTPLVTLVLIGLNVVAFFFIQPDPPFLGESTPPQEERFIYENAPAPCQLENECPSSVQGATGPIEIPERTPVEFVWSLLFSTFLHGNLIHIGGNMLFLWVFGNNVEDFLGPIKYVLFYLLGAIGSGFAQVLTNLGSAIPAIGASGAVAAILGAYFVLYPRARVNVLVPIIFIWTILQLSAFVVLGLWFLYQFIIPQPGVAWQAHAGGFIIGVLLILLFGGRPHPRRPVWQTEWRY